LDRPQGNRSRLRGKKAPVTKKKRKKKRDSKEPREFIESQNPDEERVEREGQAEVPSLKPAETAGTISKKCLPAMPCRAISRNTTGLRKAEKKTCAKKRSNLTGDHKTTKEK